MHSRKANGLRLAGMLSGCLLVWGLIDGMGIRIPCPLKALMGIPCPGCGGTRVLDALLQGDFLLAASINPFSLMVIAALAASCVWLLFDLIRGKDSFVHTLNRLNNRKTAMITIILLIAAWCRAIYTGL